MSSAKVRIQYADGRMEERELAIGTYSVGRDVGDIVLGDANVSGRHAELRVEATAVVFVDVGSTNGTFDMNGNRLAAPHGLRPNEWVRLGNSTISVLEQVVAPAGGTQLMPQVPAPGAPQWSAPGTPPQAAAPAVPVAPAPLPVASPSAPASPVPQPQYARPAAPPGYAAPPPAMPGAPVGQAPQYPPVQIPGGALSPAPVGGTGQHSHPDQPVRHSYPVSISGFGLGAAAGLLMKTAPFLGARLGILVAMSVVALVYWFIVIVGFLFLANRAPIVGWAWLIVTLGIAGWVWRAVIRYFLYLLKAGHIAVLTELITKGQIGNGSEGMFSYGKRIVKERFGEVNVLFVVDMLVDGVVRAFNRTLDWVSSLIPVPGLDSVVGFVKAVLRASTTYIDESIFSYNLARGDANVFRSSKDGLIYYAQNSKEILKTGVWVVVLEKALSFIVFWVVFLPALAFAYLLPSTFGVWVPITAIVAGLLFAADVQQAILKPLFLTMVMLKFHSVVRGQAINPEWDQRLESVSGKFKELKEKASAWGTGRAAPSPVAPAPAE